MIMPVNHLVNLSSDYKSDPYSQGDPCKSICCRNDLQEKQASPGGCYDTKVSWLPVINQSDWVSAPDALLLSGQVTDLHLAQEFVAEAVNGPTTDGGLPVFSWGAFNSTSHQGLPAKYNFSFVLMQPQLFRPWGSWDFTSDSLLDICTKTNLNPWICWIAVFFCFLSHKISVKLYSCHLTISPGQFTSLLIDW